ncbi:aminotransferase class V-fold PLP-dependent enzyme [Marinobacteraceae bacterium S3BR75-40.1]
MDLQDEFPHVSDICYLNHAAVAPWPARAREAVTAFAQENVIRGAQHYPRWLTVERELRERLSHLIHAPAPEDVALVKNTSEALSMVAYGLSWSDGDEIVITNQEFPSNRIVWESLADQGVKVVVADLESAGSPEEAIEGAVSDRTRLMSISSVQYGTGLRLDIGRLGRFCHEQEVLFCVDAIQSIGAEPLDVQRDHIDFTMADGHKWMLGPEGLGLFYVRPALRDRLKLYEFGWHSVKHRGDFDRTDWELAPDAQRFECGSPNLLGAHVLNASVSLLLESGLDHVRSEIGERVQYLREAVSSIPNVVCITPEPPERRGGIFTFRLEGRNNEALQKTLMGKGVVCAYRGGGIRFSPHFYTPYETIDRAVESIRHEASRH